MAIPLQVRFRWLINAADRSDGAVAPLANGTVYAYEAGTSDPKDTYTTSLGSVENTNPVQLDAEGYPESGGIYLGSGFYKIVIKDADGVTVISQDNVPGTLDLIDTITAHSTTSVSIGTGTKTFTIEADKALPEDAFVLITYDDDPTKYMHGQITDYTGTTLEVNVGTTAGSGTYGAWTISLSGPAGPQGSTGASGAGSGDVVGPGSAGNGYFALFDGTSGKLLKNSSGGPGSAAYLDVGTGALQVVQFTAAQKYPANDGSLITNLNASALASGTVPVARLGTGSGGAGDKFLADDGTWKAVTASLTAGAIGSFILATCTSVKTFGQTVSGSSLKYAGIKASTSQQITILESSGSPSGTWQCLGHMATIGTATEATLWQRTA